MARQRHDDSTDAIELWEEIEEELRDRVEEAIQQLVGGETLRDIAQHTGFSIGVITRLCERRHWNHLPTLKELEKLAQAYGLQLHLTFE